MIELRSDLVLTFSQSRCLKVMIVNMLVKPRLLKLLPTFYSLGCETLCPQFTLSASIHPQKAHSGVTIMSLPMRR
jgi:hypothetical protein